ncbi:MAG: hypothetical protein QNL62_10700 [Gammaproteobacteria bacterium]|nr:hypothetical protein [Gammaproteobacteria bacterium]
MINKQRGVIDPWTLGFLISLAGLAIAQPWDRHKENTSEKEEIAINKAVTDNLHKPAELIIEK